MFRPFMSYAAAKVIIGYTSISIGAVTVAYLVACEFGNQPAVALHSPLFG